MTPNFALQSVKAFKLRFWPKILEYKDLVRMYVILLNKSTYLTKPHSKKLLNYTNIKFLFLKYKLIYKL